MSETATSPFAFLRKWFRRPAKKSSGPSAPDDAAKEMQRLINIIDSRTERHAVAVSSLKGGVTKTTTTLGMGTAFALHRREPVLAIDANPHRGNLADRLGVNPAYTVRDLAFNAPQITTNSMFRHFVAQAPSRLEVMTSESNPDEAQAFDASEYGIVIDLASRFRELLITDTGIDLTLPLMDEVYKTTDTLVVPATTAMDAAQLAWETLNWWESKGRGDLVERAVVAITQIEAFTIPKTATWTQDEIAERRYAFEEQQHARQLELGRRFGPRVGTVVFVPYDPALRTGGLFVWDELTPATREAYVRIAAAVAGQFES